MRSAVVRILLYSSVWSAACGSLGLVSLYAPESGGAGVTCFIHQANLVPRAAEAAKTQDEDSQGPRRPSRPSVVRPPVDREAEGSRLPAAQVRRAGDERRPENGLDSPALVACPVPWTAWFLPAPGLSNPPPATCAIPTGTFLPTGGPRGPPRTA